MSYETIFVHKSQGEMTLSESICGQLCDLATELITLEDGVSQFDWEVANSPDLPLTMDALCTEDQYEAGEGLIILLEPNTENVIGFFKFVPENNLVTIFYFIIRKEHRGKGFGSILIDIGKECIRDLGHDELMLYYKTSNQAAVKFWTKHGFPPIVMMGSHKLSREVTDVVLSDLG